MMGRSVAINENGEVAGWLASSTGFTLFVWSASAGMCFLPMLPGEDQQGVYAINDAGVVAGWSGRSAVIWENGILKVVHHDPNGWSVATDVNNLGEVVGFTEAQINIAPQTAWKWSAASGFQLLPTLQGNEGIPWGINDRGQVVGYGESTTSGSVAFFHEGGVTRPLTAGPIGVSRASGISETGLIVGSTADGRGLMWEPDGTTSIVCSPVIAAKGYAPWCAGYAVNSKGVVVGAKSDKFGQGTRAYKWSQAGP
jgi:probable HAF family extracellular repeat protein